MAQRQALRVLSAPLAVNRLGRRSRWVVGIAAALLGVLAIGWHGLGAPRSVAEARFRLGLASAAAGPASTLDLAQLMPGDWELVCDSHCYDGELVLAQYGKRYPAVSACHDGAWGVLFIRRDGSFSSATGSCAASNPRLELGGCLPREQATLSRSPLSEPCPVFARSKR